MKVFFGKLVFLLSLLVFTVGFSGGAAAEEEFRLPEGNGIEVNMQESLGQKAELIKLWSCTIADNSNGTVAIYGETITYDVVDYLEAEVFLQRWNGSKWNDVTSRLYSKGSHYYVRGSSIIPVTAGYYRCRGVHYAEDAGSSGSRTSVSNALYID